MENQEIFIPSAVLARHLQKEFGLKETPRSLEVEILRWLIDNKYNLVKTQRELGKEHK